jgi:hypothetical protein
MRLGHAQGLEVRDRRVVIDVAVRAAQAVTQPTMLAANDLAE